MHTRSSSPTSGPRRPGSPSARPAISSAASGMRTRTPFDAATCSAPDDRVERMRDIVLDHAPRDRPIRVLDVGCGTGTLAFSLASALPQASVTGVDVSPANIRAADARIPGEKCGSRVCFAQSDYLRYAATSAD